MRLISRRAVAAGVAASCGLPKLVFGKPQQLCGSVADAPVGPPVGPTCSPINNAVPLVQFNGNVSGLALPNVSPFGPSNFSFLLHSSWHCCPIGSGPVTGCDLTFAPINVFAVNVGDNYAAAATCEIKVYQATPPGTVQFDGNYSPLPKSQWHVLISVNTDTKVVQLYVNDVAYTPTSGGWTGSGQMSGFAGPGANTVLDVGSTGGMYAAVADIWEMATPGWVDLSVVANRRKFINADLSPVDLGANGQNPFGTPPNFYLEASSGVATDFAINKGTSGGTFTINLDGPLTMQAPGACPCAVPCGQKTVVLTSGTSWTVPADWNSANNKIEAIAGGQGGGFGFGTGGGGAAYTFLANVALTPGAVVPIAIGQGGAGQTSTGTGSDYGLPGTATNFNGGQIVADPAGIGGGSASGLGLRCTPAGVDGAGGGASSLFQGGGGGGGAGGRNGAGAVGGSPNISGAGLGGGGGGGAASGGGAGQNASTSSGNGGAGGVAFNGTHGGVAGTVSATNGGAGASGSGGGGGYGATGVEGDGGAGSADPAYSGSGGGGAGGGTGPGGVGGLYGGGGGAGRPGGQGGNGVLIITYLGIC